MIFKLLSKIIIIQSFLIVSIESKCTEPDSLLGSYVGTRWVRDFFVCDTCWVASYDTLAVKKISVSVEYSSYAAVVGKIIPITSNFHFNLVTDYGFGFDSIRPWFRDWAYFYNGDSVEMFIREFSKPPEHGYHPYGFKFLGKRVSSNYLVSDTKLAAQPNIKVMGSNGELVIYSGISTGMFLLTDIMGRTVFKTAIKSPETHISSPPKGLLLYRYISTNGKVQTGRVVVQ